MDNCPASHLPCPDSGVLIHDWLADDKPDVELARVQQLLDSVIQMTLPASDDYAAQLATSAGHTKFREQLQVLNERMETPPELGANLRQHLKDVVADFRRIQAEVLPPDGPTPP